jgi:uncharacterized surface protein with fasciclin (FAS1) repeats
MNTKTNYFLITILSFVLVAFTACNDGKKKEEDKSKEEKTEMKSDQKEEKASEEKQATIAELAMETESLSTLVKALKAAELATMFNEPGSYTVFAPTNEAFANLPEGTLESLLKPENKETLQNVLKYHVVAKEVMAGDLLEKIKSNDGSFTFSTVAGAEMTAMLKDEKVMLKDGAGNMAEVVKTDVDASNGVVHVINAVVMAE